VPLISPSEASWLCEGVASGMALHLPRLKDLDGLDIRIFAPAAGFALGQRTVTHSAWLQASMPLGQSLLGGCVEKWITTQCE
jgi:hypothetical protein